MQLHRVLSLVLLALVGPLDVVAGPTEPVADMSNCSDVHSAGGTGASLPRYLRTNAVADFRSGEERAGMTEKVATFFSPSKVTPERLQKLLKQGKSADAVFTRTRFEREWSLLSRPKFAEWLKYVDDLNAKYPTKATPAISTLTARYGDATVYEILKHASSFSGTEEMATRLQKEQLKLWMSTARTPDDVLRYMSLDLPSRNLLTNPESAIWVSPPFSRWLKYTEAFNKQYPQQKSTVIEILTRIFGHEDLARMLAKAKSKDATRTLATTLEFAQTEMWRSSGKSVEDVRKLLDLQLKPGFSGNPLLNTWLSYMGTYLKENPGKTTAMLSKLEAECKDRAMNQILLAAMKFPSMERVATKMQMEKINGYMAASNESPGKDFLWLDLDNVGDSLLINPLFAKWLDYAKNFNKKNPDQQYSVYTPFRVRYNRVPVEEMIKKAMKNPSTVSIANLIQRERSGHWLDEKKLPRDVFHFLDLNNAGEKTLGSPNFKVWSKYLKDFNYRYPTEKTTMIDELWANYNDRALVELLHAAKQDSSTKKLVANWTVSRS